MGQLNYRSFRSLAAFTLVEIMLVTVLIGLLAAIAMPLFARYRDRAVAARFINDVRVFSNAFEVHLTEAGVPPAASAPGAVPAGMSDALPAAWTRPAPVGGAWAWTVDGATRSIAAVGATAPESVYARIERELDDGDPSAGRLRQVGDAWTYRVVEN